MTNEGISPSPKDLRPKKQLTDADRFFKTEAPTHVDLTVQLHELASQKGKHTKKSLYDTPKSK